MYIVNEALPDQGKLGFGKRCQIGNLAKWQMCHQGQAEHADEILLFVPGEEEWQSLMNVPVVLLFLRMLKKLVKAWSGYVELSWRGTECWFCA